MSTPNRRQLYLAYLKSRHWAQLKVRLFRHYPRRCAVCCAEGIVDAHHLIYRDPIELGVVRDLMPLCRLCHDIVHTDRRVHERIRQAGHLGRRWRAVQAALGDLYGIFPPRGMEPTAWRRRERPREEIVPLNRTVLHEQKPKRQWVGPEEFAKMVRQRRTSDNVL